MIQNDSALKKLEVGLGRQDDPVGFEGHIRELVAGHPSLEVITSAPLSARAALRRQLDGFEKRLRAIAHRDTRARLLMTTPGVGVIVALTTGRNGISQQGSQARGVVDIEADVLSVQTNVEAARHLAGLGARPGGYFKIKAICFVVIAIIRRQSRLESDNQGKKSVGGDTEGSSQSQVVPPQAAPFSRAGRP